jgi:hypothetical protein
MAKAMTQVRMTDAAEAAAWLRLASTPAKTTKKTA